MHSFHPDVHVAGLADDCPGCAEIAENPFANADRDLLRGLVALAADRERHAKARSTCELVASTTVLNTLERAGKIAQDVPDLLEGYLRKNWRVECRIMGSGY